MSIKSSGANGTDARQGDKNDRIGESVEKLHEARSAIAKIVFGNDAIVTQLFVGLMCGGHVLIEGAPGMGKTLLVRTLGDVCGLSFSRVQFTPDLMPSDITGTIVLVHDDTGRARTEFQAGPIFSQLVLADEINRATPKTQSALLEAMQEGTVTIAGVEYALPEPFFVMATQNPIEMDGTYLLPEAQLDRFLFKVEIPYPDANVLSTILDATTGAHDMSATQVVSAEEVIRLQSMTRAIPMASHVRDAVVRFTLATQPDRSDTDQEIRDYVRYGVSPRGAQALVLAAKAHAVLHGRFHVAFDDLRAVLLPALRHRFQLNFEGQSRGVSAEGLLVGLFEQAVGDEN